MMNSIGDIVPKPDMALHIVFIDGVEGIFDVRPYLADEAFEALKDPEEFMKLHNGGYFVEWECGADLSADTLRAKMKILSNAA
jgi:hypothetical protein